MPKFDVIDQQSIIDFKIPEPPLNLKDEMTDPEIEMYIKQELKKIHELNESFLVKEMMKEDLYDIVAPKINNIDNFM